MLRGINVATQVAQHVLRECQFSVSVDTMRRALHVVEPRSKVKQKKPKWNHNHIKDRLELAIYLENWTICD